MGFHGPRSATVGSSKRSSTSIGSYGSPARIPRAARRGARSGHIAPRARPRRRGRPRPPHHDERDHGEQRKEGGSQELDRYGFLDAAGAADRSLSTDHPGGNDDERRDEEPGHEGERYADQAVALGRPLDRRGQVEDAAVRTASPTATSNALGTRRCQGRGRPGARTASRPRGLSRHRP